MVSLRMVTHRKHDGPVPSKPKCFWDLTIQNFINLRKIGNKHPPRGRSSKITAAKGLRPLPLVSEPESTIIVENNLRNGTPCVLNTSSGSIPISSNEWLDYLQNIVDISSSESDYEKTSRKPLKLAITLCGYSFNEQESREQRFSNLN